MNFYSNGGNFPFPLLKCSKTALIWKPQLKQVMYILNGRRQLLWYIFMYGEAVHRVSAVKLSTQFMAFVPGRYQVCWISFLCLSWVWPQLVTLNHVQSFLQAFIIPVNMLYRVYWFLYTLFTGEVLGFENLVFSIFEFVSALVDGHKLSMRVESVLTDLLYYLILFMQITEEQVSNNNIMNFVLWEISQWNLNTSCYLNFIFLSLILFLVFISVCLELY